jgi:heterotetrameric sarcosine oxidase gamma subunit
VADLDGPPPRQSALGDLLATRRPRPEAGPPSIHLTERPVRLLWQIAAWRTDDIESLRATVAKRLGLCLPQGPRAADNGDLLACQVAPRRWWLVAPAPSTELPAGLPDALAERAALTDLSHAWTVVRLAGPGSRSTLEKLCRIDLHPRAFPPGRIAQTPLGRIAALIHALDGGLRFDIYLPRSLARSTTISLMQAAGEFGLALDDAG